MLYCSSVIDKFFVVEFLKYETETEKLTAFSFYTTINLVLWIVTFVHFIFYHNKEKRKSTTVNTGVF